MWAMYVDDALSIYQTQKALAADLDVTAAAISVWRKRYGGKIPELYARRLHEKTRGKLRFNRDDYLVS